MVKKDIIITAVTPLVAVITILSSEIAPAKAQYIDMSGFEALQQYQETVQTQTENEQVKDHSSIDIKTDELVYSLDGVSVKKPYLEHTEGNDYFVIKGKVVNNSKGKRYVGEINIEIERGSHLVHVDNISINKKLYAGKSYEFSQKVYSNNLKLFKTLHLHYVTATLSKTNFNPVSTGQAENYSSTDEKIAKVIYSLEGVFVENLHLKKLTDNQYFVIKGKVVNNSKGERYVGKINIKIKKGSKLVHTDKVYISTKLFPGQSYEFFKKVYNPKISQHASDYYVKANLAEN